MKWLRPIRGTVGEVCIDDEAFAVLSQQRLDAAKTELARWRNPRASSDVLRSAGLREDMMFGGGSQLFLLLNCGVRTGPSFQTTS